MSVLTGQIAAITGASSGIGKGITLSLADERPKVCLVRRNLKNLVLVARRSPENFVKAFVEI